MHGLSQITNFQVMVYGNCKLVDHFPRSRCDDGGAENTAVFRMHKPKSTAKSAAVKPADPAPITTKS